MASSQATPQSEISKTQLFEDKIFTLSNVLTPSECGRWIKLSEYAGFNPSPPSGGGHGRTGREDPRTSQFLVIVDKNKSQAIWERIQPFLPKDCLHLTKTAYITSAKDAASWSPIAVNPRFRVYKYEKGQAFPEHIDYKICRTVWRGGQKYKQQTFMTLLVYLNDQQEFQAGETGFWTQHDAAGVKEHCRFLRDQENKPHQIVVTPQTGMALISDQNILHEGIPPTKGIKYVLRTDIVHEKHMPHHPKVLETLTEHDLRDREEPWEKQFETSCKNYAD